MSTEFVYNGFCNNVLEALFKSGKVANVFLGYRDFSIVPTSKCRATSVDLPLVYVYVCY